MDTKTPPILSKHQDKLPNKADKTTSTKSADISLPPLTSNNCRQKSKSLGVQWNKRVPYVNNQERHKKRPFRVLQIGATALMHACQQGDRSRVIRLLKEQEETVDYRDRTLRNALHYCMDAATGGVVASAAPELVNAPDAEGHTPLHLAVIAGDTQLVAVLLANGADVNAKDLEGHSVLHWATVCGEAECVRLVLAAGARPSTPDLRGGSPLHYAAQCCGAAVTAELSVPKKIGIKVLQTLLEFGADVNAKDEDGRQPILWAASAGSVEAVLALARTGGSAAAGATDKDGLTALHCAASRGHARCVEALVNLCGAQPDHVDDNGCSALHYAATLGHADATALLLRLGADPNRQDRKGRTPALCAAAKGQLETLKILAQHGGSLHARTIRGTGVAHESVLSGRIELIEWLAKKKPATLDVATHDGRTPLHVAALYGYLDVCKVLLDHGARINTVFRTSKSGPMTPLDAALYRGHRDCAKLIQMHGGTTAHNLRTHKTAPNKIFAAKLQVKRPTSSSESENDSGRRRKKDPDIYIEERWIEKRTRKRSNPGKHEHRRGSRSYSEEEIRISKSCRDQNRRAKSESARYDESDLETNGKKKCSNKKYSKHEYSESSSDFEDVSSDEVVEGKTHHKMSNRRRNKTRENEYSLSDDSLEVIVVRRSMEKKSERIEYSERKLKTPKEIRLTETSRKSSKRAPKTSRDSRVEDKSAKNKESEDRQSNSSDKKSEDEKKKKRKERKLSGKDVTDSTSHDTVERVTVTALVHKDQALDTPRLPQVDVSEIDREEIKGLSENEIAKNKIDEILEKADELQNSLIIKAADLKKDVDEIRRQMTGNKSLDSDKNDDQKNSTVEDEEEGKDEFDEIEKNLDEPLQSQNHSEKEDDNEISNRIERRTSEDKKISRRESEDKKDSRRTSEDKKDSRRTSEDKKDSRRTSEDKKDSRRTSEDKKDSRRTSEAKNVQECYQEKSENTDIAEKNEEINSERRESVKSESHKIEPGKVDDNDKESDLMRAQSRNTGSSSPKSSSDRETNQGDETDDKNSEIEKHGGESRKSSTASMLKKEEDNKMVEIEKEDGKTAKNSQEVLDKEEKPAEASSEAPEKIIKEEKQISHNDDNDDDDDDGDDDDDDDDDDNDNDGNDGDDDTSTKKFRHIDSSSSSAKSSKKLQQSRPSTGKNKRRDSNSKANVKQNLFESSEERSLDRSAIIAVFESPEWDEEDEKVAEEIRDVIGDNVEPETDPEDDDSLGVLRVLPSTSDDETPRKPKRLSKMTKNDLLPRVEHKFISNSRRLRQQPKQRRDSGGRDSGIEPSPRVSKIPKRMLKKCCPNTEKQQALNIDTITRDVQINLRKYHLERKIFFQLMELKRLQIRHGRANEQVLVKRQVDVFHKAGMSGPALGVSKYDQPYTFKNFESFLYEQLRRLQKRTDTPDWCTEAKQCTEKTHRCHHATSAYTSLPIYTYLGGGGQNRDEGTLLPKLEGRGKGQMTVKVTRGEEKQIIALPAERLDSTKRYFVTFTVRGENQQGNDVVKTTRDAQRNTKSV